MMPNSKMEIIGITGGAGSGKSAVLDIFTSQYQGRTIRLDDVARQLQEPGQACYQAMVALLGDEILLPDGQLNREAIATQMYQQKGLRLAINEIVHPAVRRWVVDDIVEQRNSQQSLYVVEAALLIEAKYSEICDRMWYIYASETIRRQRLKASRGYSDEKISRIFASQLSEREFRAHCDIVIDNNQGLPYTQQQIGELL